MTRVVRQIHFFFVSGAIAPPTMKRATFVRAKSFFVEKNNAFPKSEVVISDYNLFNYLVFKLHTINQGGREKGLKNLSKKSIKQENVVATKNNVAKVIFKGFRGFLRFLKE